MVLYVNNEKLQVIIGGQKYKILLPTVVSDFVQAPILVDGKIIGYFTAQTPTANSAIYGGLVEVE